MSRLIRNIELAIDFFNQQDYYSGLNFATLAIEETARQFYGRNTVTRTEYIDFVRRYYWVLERFMGAPECSAYTLYSSVYVTDERSKRIGGCLGPDLAQIVYYIFRCYIHHGKELPSQFIFTDVVNGASLTIVSANANGTVALPANVIIGLVAICVICRANVGISTDSSYFLTLDTSVCIYSLCDCSQAEIIMHSYILHGETLRFDISKCLGREHMFRTILHKCPRQPKIFSVSRIEQNSRKLILVPHDINKERCT